jgi:hypothetical protein
MSGAALADERCLHHPAREAVARCVGCRQFFCRECITEYEDRIVCATCLQTFAAKRGGTRRRWRTLLAPAQFAIGLLIAWLFFYFGGSILILIPSRFHEGTVWLNSGALSDE